MRRGDIYGRGYCTDRVSGAVWVGRRPNADVVAAVLDWTPVPGIPDFRSDNGLYSKLANEPLPYPEAMFTLDYFLVPFDAAGAYAAEGALLLTGSRMAVDVLDAWLQRNPQPFMNLLQTLLQKEAKVNFASAVRGPSALH